MSNIQSQRLSLIPLTLEHLNLLSRGRKLLETSMGLKHSQLEINWDDSFLRMLDQAINHYIIPNVQVHGVQYEWFTHWIIVETATNICIGGIGGSGLPDKNGQVMLGYYIDKKFEGLGYATEALGAFIRWMRIHPDLISIVADTPIHHMASQKVLGKNGFVLLGEVEDGYRWQLNV